MTNEADFEGTRIISRSAWPANMQPSNSAWKKPEAGTAQLFSENMTGELPADLVGSATTESFDLDDETARTPFAWETYRQIKNPHIFNEMRYGLKVWFNRVFRGIEPNEPDDFNRFLGFHVPTRSNPEDLGTAEERG